MNKAEAIQAFPLKAQVRLKAHPSIDFGVVTGHDTYNVAFIGLRTFIVVETPAGRPLGEFAPKDLEVVSDGPS